MTTHHHDVGSVGEEATRLFAAFEDWARGTFGGAHVPDLGELPLAGSASEECRLCPVCTALRLVRGARPEVYTHLLTATDALAAALRAALENPAHGRTPHPGVEHIDVR